MADQRIPVGQRISDLSATVADLGTVVASAEVTFDRIVDIIEAEAPNSDALRAVLEEVRAHKTRLAQAIVKGTIAADEAEGVGSPASDGGSPVIA